jgi:hypothetical protein
VVLGQGSSFLSRLMFVIYMLEFVSIRVAGWC